MDCEAEKYYFRLLSLLDSFAESHLSYRDYKIQANDLWRELGNERTHFGVNTPVEYAMMSQFLTSAIAQVSPDEVEEVGEPKTVARALYRDLISIIVLKTRMYTSSPATFEPGNYLSDAYNKAKRPVQHFADFVAQQNGVPETLSPVQLKALHGVYLELYPVTLLEILCIEALQALLPWLAEGIGEDSFPSMEYKEFRVPDYCAACYAKWLNCLTGRSSFSAKLRFYGDMVQVSLDIQD